MKAILTIPNLNTNEDVVNIKEVIAKNEGVIACEINLSKKEVNIVYDDKTIDLDIVMASIEEIGYSII